MAEEIRPLVEELGMELVTMHEWDNADVKWERATWKQELAKADMVILPANYKKQPAKSNNRLIQCLSMGLPSVCSPLRSYVEVEKSNPGCCLFAENPDEWRSQLQKLQDENIRKKMATQGPKIAKAYSIDEMGKKWLSILGENNNVDIVIPTYNNLPCLKMCLESIRACTKVPHRVIVVNNGTDVETKEYLDKQSDVLSLHTGRLNFAQAINCGIEAGKSPYICLLNDDTIVSKKWLTHLVSSISDPDVGAVGVLSNCDKGWLHNYSINIGGVDLLPGVNTLEQIEPIVQEIYNYSKNPDHPNRVDREWIAFYCTLIPRAVYSKVGKLDDGFVNSGEDVDYCRRIRKSGYKVIQNYDSFVFHFGAVGRHILESEDPGTYKESDRKTNIYLREKWGKENVVIYTGPSWERWDFRNVDIGGIGGSETWAVYLAREFDKLGYRVKVFGDCPEPHVYDGGVEYLHYTEYPCFVDRNWIDYFISSRTTDTLNFPVRAGKIFVMIHDVWLLSDREKIHLDKVYKYCALSDWHRSFVSSYHNIPEDKIWVTSNGIDFERFNRSVERNRHRMVYSSSPDRGLDTLLKLFPKIREQVPDAELHIFYGFDNWLKSIERKGDENQKKKIQEIQKAMEQPGVEYHGRIGQQELAEEFLKSSLWAYSTDFEESFCVTALEAQRAGLPVVSSNYAGLRTTVGKSGMLLGNGEKGQSYTSEYQEEFIDVCVTLLTDDTIWDNWSKKSLKNSERFSWSNVAAEWVKQFKV